MPQACQSDPHEGPGWAHGPKPTQMVPGQALPSLALGLSCQGLKPVGFVLFFLTHFGPVWNLEVWGGFPKLRRGGVGKGKAFQRNGKAEESPEVPKPPASPERPQSISPASLVSRDCHS